MWILLRGDEDGNPVTIVVDIDDLLANPNQYGITHFGDAAQFVSEPDHNYWQHGRGVLLRAEVVKPQPVTAKWELPRTAGVKAVG